MPKVNGITEKQKAFCKGVVSGLTNTEAYIQAYNCNSVRAANIESTKLLQKEHIQEYIEALHKPIILDMQNKQITEREKQIQFIKERIQICKEKDDEQSIIRYTDMLSKIFGLYKDTEQDQKPDNTISKLDTATLQKLTSA